MMLNSRPLLTKAVEDIATFDPGPDCLYLYGLSNEERSEHVEQWKDRAQDTDFVRVTAEDSASIDCEVNGTTRTILLKGDDIVLLANERGRHRICLDVTGIEHRVWAPLAKACLLRGMELSAVYVEPDHYARALDPINEMIYDLSEHVKGIEPLPGFATVYRERRSVPLFVPLLGFEGTRFSYMLEQVQPDKEHVYPVIGMPGFQPEYVFRTYQCNLRVIRDLGAWPRVKYARANCACSVFYTLLDIYRLRANAFLQIALVGTKPHALGAITFASLLIHAGRRVEVVYDHPVRSDRRTEGMGRLLYYNLSVLYETGRQLLQL